MAAAFSKLLAPLPAQHSDERDFKLGGQLPYLALKCE